MLSLSYRQARFAVKSRYVLQAVSVADELQEQTAPLDVPRNGATTTRPKRMNPCCTGTSCK
jgi:hypothetical protein